jgi:hypothetical protein
MQSSETTQLVINQKHHLQQLILEKALSSLILNYTMEYPPQLYLQYKITPYTFLSQYDTFVGLRDDSNCHVRSQDFEKCKDIFFFN